jgi:hypothetical protein
LRFGLQCSTYTAAQAQCLPVVLQVLKNVFELWFWDSKPNLVRRLMRLLLTRQLKESMHPCGETYGQVRSSGVCLAMPGGRTSGLHSTCSWGVWEGASSCWRHYAPARPAMCAAKTVPGTMARIAQTVGTSCDSHQVDSCSPSLRVQALLDKHVRCLFTCGGLHSLTLVYHALPTQVYYRTWLEHFDQLWTFNDHSAGACHAHVCLHHYLTDKQIATIRDSGVPIVCQVRPLIGVSLCVLLW